MTPIRTMATGWFLQLHGPVLHERERLSGAYPALLGRQSHEDAALVPGGIWEFAAESDDWSPRTIAD